MHVRAIVYVFSISGTHMRFVSISITFSLYTLAVPLERITTIFVNDGSKCSVVAHWHSVASTNALRTTIDRRKTMKMTCEYHFDIDLPCESKMYDQKHSII